MVRPWEPDDIHLHESLASRLLMRVVPEGSLECWFEGYTDGTFGVIEVSGDWHLVHVASGLRLPGAQYASLEAAKKAASRIGTLPLDWSRVCPFNGATHELQDRYKGLL